MAISDTTARKYELQDPDVRLMLQVRDDSATAFEELMVRYQNRVIRVMEHLVRRRDMAEDLTQDVFLRIYRARKRYVPGSKFSTWLFTIVNNVASNALRSLSRRREVNMVATESGPRIVVDAGLRLAVNKAREQLNKEVWKHSESRIVQRRLRRIFLRCGWLVIFIFKLRTVVRHSLEGNPDLA